MKNKAKQMAVTPLLKHSLISFQEYCNRDLFAQNALIYPHQQKLYANTRNRCSFVKKNLRTNFFKTQTSNPSDRKSSLRNSQAKSPKQVQRKTETPEILNIVPAVIHNTVRQRLRKMLSQRAKSELKQSKNSKIFRCRTQSFDWNSQDNSFSLRNTANSYSSTIRPNTAERYSRLNNIRVFLPGPTGKGNHNDEEIKGWESPFEEQGL